MIDLKAKFGRTYRIALDESAEILGQTKEDRLWLQQIPGRYGHVYVHGPEALGVYVRTRRDTSNRLPRLLALPGAKLHQRGDDEATVTLPIDQLEGVAAILMLKRRRVVSPEGLARLAEMRSRIGSKGS